MCDFGVGVPTTVNNRLKDISNGKTLSDEFALRIAFRRGITAQSTPRNRGWGLDNLATSVLSMAGRITYLSNSAYLNWMDNKVEFNSLSWNMAGTIANIIYDTTKWPEKEDEVYNEEFYF